MVTRFKMGAVLVCAGLVACVGEEPSDSRVETDELTLDTASEVSALEVDEDGTDEEFADATEDAPVLDRECSLDGRKQHLGEQYDVNGDGVLDEDERETMSEDFGGGRARVRHAMREHRREMLLRLYDADRSRDLDDSERAELRADLEARLEARKAQRLVHFDLDQSGDLDDAEWEAFKADLKRRFAARRAEVMTSFDQNADGKLDHAERLAARAKVRERMEERRAALEAEFDTNGDGSLDADERASLVEALKSRVRGEHFGDH